MKVRLVSIFYFILLLTDVLCLLFKWDSIEHFVRPLLIPVLLYFLIESTKGQIYKGHLIFGAYLVAIWLGDVLLINEGTSYITGGYLAYIVGHILMIILLKNFNKDRSGGSLWIAQLSIVLLSVSLIILLTYFYWPVDNTLQVILWYILILAGTIVATLGLKMNKAPNLIISLLLLLATDVILGTPLIWQSDSISSIVIAFYGTTQYLLSSTVGKEVTG